MISVIIPVFNGEKYLDECLSSIQYDDIEIIVVDDDSTDNSEQIALKYTNNVIRIKHSGAVIARNTGIKNAHGDYIVFMDADDIFCPNAISMMYEKIKNFDGIVGMRNNFISPECKNKNPISTKTGHGAIAGCAMFKKSLFDNVGNFDENLQCGDGYDWLLRAKKFGANIQNVDNVFCMRRIHDNNMSITKQKQEYADYCKIIRKHFS